MKHLLSLDGGGIKMAMSGQLLIELESMTGRRTADCNQLIGGTSTGGIMTALLTHPKKYSAKEALELYIEYGSKIFSASLAYKIRTLGGLIGAKYQSEYIEGLLQSYMGDVKMSDLSPCIITACDIHSRQIKIFAQSDYSKYGNDGDFYVKDVCRATSAAPTYFSSHSVKSLAGHEYVCCDGGLALNNPSMALFTEAGSNPHELFVVSLGMGNVKKSYSANNWGKIEAISPVIDLLMGYSDEVIDKYLQSIYASINKPQLYTRIQPNHMGKASIEMDCSTVKNIKELVSHGKQVVKDELPTLRKIAKEWTK